MRCVNILRTSEFAGYLEKFGDVHEVVSLSGEQPLYLEVIGAELDCASKLIRLASTCCRVPEPIRVGG